MPNYKFSIHSCKTQKLESNKHLELKVWVHYPAWAQWWNPGQLARLIGVVQYSSLHLARTLRQKRPSPSVRMNIHALPLHQTQIIQSILYLNLLEPKNKLVLSKVNFHTTLFSTNYLPLSFSHKGPVNGLDLNQILWDLIHIPILCIHIPVFAWIRIQQISFL